MHTIANRLAAVATLLAAVVRLRAASGPPRLSIPLVPQEG
jgi:hypothetical protein